MPGVSGIRLRAPQLVKLASGIAVIAQRQHRQAAQQGIVHAAGNGTVQGTLQQIRRQRVVEKRQQQRLIRGRRQRMLPVRRRQRFTDSLPLLAVVNPALQRQV